MNDKPRNQFLVDFTWSDSSGPNAGRMKLQGSVMQLNGATSEFAILEHIRRQYPDYSGINIMNVTWL